MMKRAAHARTQRGAPNGAKGARRQAACSTPSLFLSLSLLRLCCLALYSAREQTKVGRLGRKAGAKQALRRPPQVGDQIEPRRGRGRRWRRCSFVLGGV